MCIKQYNKPSQTSNLWNTVVMAILVTHWAYHSIPALFYPAKEGNHTKCTMRILRTVCLKANPNAELSASTNMMHNEYPKQTAKDTVSNKHPVTRMRALPPCENTWGAVRGSWLLHEVREHQVCPCSFTRNKEPDPVFLLCWGCTCTIQMRGQDTCDICLVAIWCHPDSATTVTALALPLWQERRRWRTALSCSRLVLITEVNLWWDNPQAHLQLQFSSSQHRFYLLQTTQVSLELHAKQRLCFVALAWFLQATTEKPACPTGLLREAPNCVFLL